MNVKNHAYHFGNYKINVYATMGNGIFSGVGWLPGRGAGPGGGGAPPGATEGLWGGGKGGGRRGGGGGDFFFFF